MRKARFDLKQVVCRNSSCLGYSSNIARSGYWITYRQGGTGDVRAARVMGRIAETDRDGEDCSGWVIAMKLNADLRSTFIVWINPEWITDCYETPPADLLAWIAGDAWVKNKCDIVRLVAMAEHGTTSNTYIGNRDNPDQAYNARPEYMAQFVL